MDKGKSGGTGLETHIASTLAYLGGWLSGLILLLVETNNRVVRFHAMQSIITFGSLHIVIIVLGWVGSLFTLAAGPGTLVPVSLVFTVLWALVLAFSIVLWILLMLRSYHKQHVLLPLAGDLSFWMLKTLGMETPERDAMAFQGLGGALPLRDKERSRHARPEDGELGRAFASVAVIVWSVFLFIVFNFFPDYIAFYHSRSADGINQLLRYPILTAQLARVLPMLNLALGLSVIGHIFALVWNRYLLREIIEVVLHVLGLIVVVLFLWVFPFDFSDLPVAGLVTALPTITMVILVLAIVGNVIEIVVHSARLLRGLVAR